MLQKKGSLPLTVPTAGRYRRSGAGPGWWGRPAEIQARRRGPGWTCRGGRTRSRRWHRRDPRILAHHQRPRASGDDRQLCRRGRPGRLAGGAARAYSGLPLIRSYGPVAGRNAPGGTSTLLTAACATGVCPATPRPTTAHETAALSRRTFHPARLCTIDGQHYKSPITADIASNAKHSPSLYAVGPAIRSRR